MKNNTKKFRISVYTIAKNEEKVAERWFNCFKEADEVCVLVNNSTDKTAEILRSLGAKVVEKNYEHFRFDIARNDAMKICSPKSTLLFCCDMDDTVESGWREKVERAWELGVQTGRNPNSIIFTYSVEYNTFNKVANHSRKQKQSFARHSIHTPNGWYWKSRIHEYLEHRERKVFVYYPKFEVVSRPTKCEHGSYLPLLIEECQDPNCEARNIHLLGREYMLNGKYDEAVDWFNKYLSHVGATWDSERAASMKFLSDCYRVLGFPNAQELWLWKAMSENPRDRDAPFALGQLLMNKKEYKTAIRVLEKCLSIEKPEFDYPFFSLSAWTEMPIVCLGESRYYVGDWDGAIRELDKALSMNPKNETARKMRDEIASIIAKGGRPNLPPPEIPRERIEIPELM
jgi:glycosyltransferase involved in cell wall biosynthesis